MISKKHIYGQIFLKDYLYRNTTYYVEGNKLYRKLLVKVCTQLFDKLSCSNRIESECITLKKGDGFIDRIASKCSCKALSECL